MNDFFNKIIIEEYSNKYKDQVINVIGKTLADISVIDRNSLPINDPDLEIIEQIYSGRGNFWVALIDNEVIGTIAIRELDSDSAKLNRMFVLTDYHGIGIGQKLLKIALNFAKDQGFKKIILNTHIKMLRAHKFYEKNGFKKTGKTNDKFQYEKYLD